jgi:methyl-accepting chemotaxis protein
MDLNTAIHLHAQWKTKLRAAIIKQEQLDVDTISKDNCCDLGKWLHGDAKSQYGQLISHTTCIKSHAEFHIEAGKVALAINDKKYSEAENMIDTGPYAQASNNIGAAIMRLKKEISASAPA